MHLDFICNDVKVFVCSLHLCVLLYVIPVVSLPLCVAMYKSLSLSPSYVVSVDECCKFIKIDDLSCLVFL